MTEPDPLSDALTTLVRHGLDRELCQRLIAEVRGRWGGGQVYIRAIDRRGRDAAIKESLAEGLPVTEVARRVKTSVATVRRRRSEWL